MPPYYMSDCVEYYSPSLGFKQCLVTFVVGFLLGSLLSELNQQIRKPEGERQDAIDLARQVNDLENRLSRAFRVIVVLCLFVWFCFVAMIVQTHSSANIKTEL